MNRKLTKQVVDSIKPSSREVHVWDTEIRGFCLKITPKGKRIYMLYYRTLDGRQRKPKIGEHGIITPDQARTKARLWLAEVSQGGDPSGEREFSKEQPTMNELAVRYFEEYANKKKKESSLISDRRNMQKHILPRLGKEKVVDVTRQHAHALHYSMRKSPGAANRCLALLSKMMNLAEKWSIRPDGSNPCRHVERNPERKMERFLNLEEIGRLSDVLCEAERERTEPLYAIAAIRLLLLTGCRHGEILTLKWDYVDMASQCIRFPDSKTGAKVTYIPPAAIEILRELPRVKGNPYVIVGLKEGNHLINLTKSWKRICRVAELEKVRIHDMRHTYASVAAAGGMSLHMIGSLLGHSQPATTARYAHLIGDPMRQAAARVGDTLVAAMRGNQAEIIALHA